MQEGILLPPEVSLQVWDGTTWSALGGGVSNPVNAIYALDASNVYAGGGFTNAGGVSANYIAKWNGTNWTVLGSGTSSIVRAIYAVNENNVYVGGSFTGLSRIAKWDGTNWTAMGTGVSGGAIITVNSIYALGANNVYAGGSFTTAGGVTVNNIAVWK